MSFYSLIRDFSHSNNVIQCVIKKAKYHSEKRRLSRFHKVGYKVNSEIYEVLKKTQYQYFALAGTLLGIIREEGFIAYDNDLDYGVMIEDNEGWNDFYNYMKKRGFHLKHFFVEDDTVTELTFLYRGVSIDFYGMKDKGDHLLTCSYYRNKDQSYKKNEVSTMHVKYPILEGITEILCHASVFPVPTNSEGFLESNYGSNWKTPMKNVKINNKIGTRQFLDSKISHYYSVPRSSKKLL